MKKEKIDADIRTNGANYCLKCWIDFTTMTPEEIDNYSKIEEYLGYGNTTGPSKSVGRKSKPIICNETGVEYASLKVCATEIGSNVATISRHITQGKPTKIKELTFRYIERGI